MRYFLLALSVVFIFMACSKSTTPSTTRLDILRGSAWSMASGTISVKLPSGKKDTTLNYFNFVPKCHQDDYITFNSLTDGAVHSNGTTCSPHDPDSVTFQYLLSNNYNNIAFYRGFSLVWSLVESVQPLWFDTTQTFPFYVVDTIHGVNDTLPGYTRSVVVLDSIWKLRFDSLYVPTLTITDGSFQSFGDNSFTIYFTQLGTYPDTTNHHTGTPFYDPSPVIRADTFKYTITFNKR